MSAEMIRNLRESGKKSGRPAETYPLDYSHIWIGVCPDGHYSHGTKLRCPACDGRTTVLDAKGDSRLTRIAVVLNKHPDATI